jgi:hypothetical protein
MVDMKEVAFVKIACIIPKGSIVINVSRDSIVPMEKIGMKLTSVSHVTAIISIAQAIVRKKVDIVNVDPNFKNRIVTRAQKAILAIPTVGLVSAS